MSGERDRALLELEQRLARIGEKVSATDASALIADDFVEFGASGKIWSKAEITAAMADWPPLDGVLENFTVRELSGSVCLVTYRLVGRAGAGSSLRSSLWRRTGERWQIIFHQGTKL